MTRVQLYVPRQSNCLQLRSNTILRWVNFDILYSSIGNGGHGFTLPTTTTGNILGTRNGVLDSIVNGHGIVNLATLNGYTDFFVDICLNNSTTVEDSGYFGYVDNEITSRRFTVSKAETFGTRILVEVGDFVTVIEQPSEVAVITIEYKAATNTVTVLYNGVVSATTSNTFVFEGVDFVGIGAVLLKDGSVSTHCIDGVLFFGIGRGVRDESIRTNTITNILSSYGESL